jgi:NAD(P)-dependent dehydrogenase (short-subunit alcohol dehydrogenase family)
MTIAKKVHRIVDRALEASVVGSFTRLGILARQSHSAWEQFEPGALSGKHVVITGATSGLGEVTAKTLRHLGARVTILARNLEKARTVAAQLGEDCKVVHAEMSDLTSIRRAAKELVDLDVLIHNAGALDDTYQVTPQGLEHTVATHVVGPFLLTRLVATRFASKGRIIWVSSGGMYTEDLDVDALMTSPTPFDGVKAYARAKRAQVVLCEMLAARLPVRVHAMHPGWADTPGVARSLPTFRTFTRGMLRSPAEGADTIVWLAASDGAPATSTGQFWLDREIRPTHRLARTARSDTPEARARFWSWLEDVTAPFMADSA